MPQMRFPAAARSLSTLSRGDPVWAQDPSNTALESKFPNILTTIQLLWGHKELNTYFTKLTLNDRTAREGFPPEVWDEIQLLLRLHLEIVPQPLFINVQARHARDFRRF